MEVPELEARIEPEWIDYNGHLNMARYPILFDRAIDLLIDAVGLSSEPGDGATLFAAEAQLRYLRAVMPQDRPRVLTRILRVDAKRVHSWQEMRVGDGIAATCENLHLCVVRKGETAKVAPFAEAVRSSLENLVSGETWPEGCGIPVAARMGNRGS